eukprot:scaffold297599_cov33-Tisochrysis_lutea.AAC.2
MLRCCIAAAITHQFALALGSWDDHVIIYSYSGQRTAAWMLHVTLTLTLENQKSAIAPTVRGKNGYRLHREAKGV